MVITLGMVLTIPQIHMALIMDQILMDQILMDQILMDQIRMGQIRTNHQQLTLKHHIMEYQITMILTK